MAAMLIKFVLLDIVCAAPEIGAHLFNEDLMTQAQCFPNFIRSRRYRDSK